MGTSAREDPAEGSEPGQFAVRQLHEQRIKLGDDGRGTKILFPLARKNYLNGMGHS